MKILIFSISFVLAFLLFAVQPMATKMVLPTLGGTPAVWNTAMLTFQLLLLAGYAYAHVLTQHVPARRQWWLHGALVLASFSFLPLAVVLQSSEELIRHPISHLALAFLLQMGLPFFALSATAPLLQAWVSRSQHPLSKTPYVLYSASNLGSMVGLLGYIALVEPSLTLPQQSHAWSGLYVAGTLALIFAAVQLKPVAATREEQGVSPTLKTMLCWVWLAFLPSSLSLGVTSYISTDIASMPLLWVLPLSIYLLSFVDAFATRPRLVGISIRVAPILGIVGLLMYGMQGHRFSATFIIQLLVFASLAFALHGWLARFKPVPAQLTRFYFCMSIGGALGGVLNAIVAPLVFSEAYEYPISLIFASVTAFMLWQRTRSDIRTNLHAFSQVAFTMLVATGIIYAIMSYGNKQAIFGPLNSSQMVTASAFAAIISAIAFRTYMKLYYAFVMLGLVMLLAMAQGVVQQHLLFKQRSFFGVWRVFEYPEKNSRFMMHNTTVHSAEYIDQKEPLRALSYYNALSSAFALLPVTHQHPIALVGLGAGTVQCFAQTNQRVDIFEIDPIVVRLAEDPKMFRYLSDCPGTHEVFLGDGRLELAMRDDARYGAIILDAFSSDAIPAHLMTLEAMRMYMQKLAPHGVLLLHTTNRHIDLWPLIAAQADGLGAVAYGKFFDIPKERPLEYSSFWVVVARNEADIADLVAGDEGWSKLVADKDARPWTDNYSNMIPYFKILRGE